MNSYTSLNNTSIEKVVHFLFEAGMLRHTPRSGYPFLCTGRENVAEYSY